MRLDLPHEMPRRRQPDASRSEPLDPSPLDRHKNDLRHQAENRRDLDIPRTTRKASEPLHDQPRQDRKPKIPEAPAVSHRVRRQKLPEPAIGLSLRNEELRALAEIGKFRVLSTRDLAATVYDGHYRALERDLRFLQLQGVLRIDSVNGRRDGRSGRTDRIEVVTLTKAGRDLVNRTAELPKQQKIYAGLVKPREVEHDTEIYRAYLKEAERIAHAGGTNLRVQLDFELKAKIQKAIYIERKRDPERNLNEIKQQVAQQFELPFVNAGIQIPDARIEYELGQGSLAGHQDIEVLTAAYRPGHLRNKAQAGFHLYASSADRATLTAKIEEDHHLLENILEL
jgi:hypothetical protein